MYKFRFFPAWLLICIASLSHFVGYSQTSHASIDGPTCIHTGSTYTYTVSTEYSGTANFNYFVTSGTLADGTTNGTHSGPASIKVDVTWSGAGTIFVSSPG